MKTRRNMVKRWIAGVLAVTMLSSTMSTAAFAAPESTDAPETAETIQVTAWSWTDGSALTWQEDTSAWTLALSETQTISAEADLLALLPASVEATLAQPETEATPAPESTADTDAAEVTPTPEAEVDPAVEEGATAAAAPAAETADVPEEDTTGVAALSVESEDNEETTPAPETATPASDASTEPAESTQPAESTEPAADAEPTEEPAAEADTETLTLTWDTAALSYPLAGGDYTVTATLPEGYALAEGAPALTVAVQVPGAEDEDVPAADNSLSGSAGAYAPSMLANVNTIATTDPVGTTINLFDYWINTENAPDNTFQASEWFGILCTNAGDQGKGINQNHILKFSYYGHAKKMSGANDFHDPYLQEIVQNKLSGDGYPILNNLDPDIGGTGGTGIGAQENLRGKQYESLAYLFNPSSDYDNGFRRTFADVKGLLTTTADGYYSYDSDTNYAYFDKSDSNTTNSFVVYDAPHFGFFPFNTPDEVYQNPEEGYNNDIVANHYFGLTMSTRFVQQNKGISTRDNSTPVTYEFTGDDDVWVFIDNVLVGDLGGIHSRASLKIDFSTGLVTTNNDVSAAKTLRDIFTEAGSENVTNWHNGTFADNTYHTLQLFYLERGNNQSNLKLKFNMESVSASSINTVDQDGHPLSNVYFDLYAANDQYETVGGQPLVSNVTNVNGVLNLQDDNNNNLTLQNLKEMVQKAGGTNLLLKLKDGQVPAGYRSSGDIKLKFLENTGDLDIVLSADPWTSGAYASPTVTVTLPNTVYDTSGQPIDTQANTTTGTFFAVVLQRDAVGDDNTSNWRPVYGDAMNGWQVADDSTWQSVITAAQNSSYTFTPDNAGERVTIENLPGDLQKYYYILQQKTGYNDQMAASEANYTIAYYYTDGELDNATEGNTVRLQTDNPNSKIEREFSVRVYAPFIKNYLIVQAVGPDGTTKMNGATFELYKSEDVEPGEDGKLVLKEGAKSVDDVTTAAANTGDNTVNMDGAAVFPSAGHLLEKGMYYLKTPSISGYETDTQFVKVIVDDDSGVYADAGEEKDDVTVLRGAGKIVRSMLQFAVPDHINTTLTDITATQYAATTAPESIGGPWEWGSTAIKTLNLTYTATKVPLEYGPMDPDDNSYIEVEEGWSKLKITQYQSSSDGGSQTGNDIVQDEKVTEDLSNLFSRSTVVRVKNTVKLCDLTISNTIKGTAIGNDNNQQFDVTITLTEGTMGKLEDSYKYTVGSSPEENDLTLSDVEGSEGTQPSDPVQKVGTVKMTPGQTITVKNIPFGTGFAVAAAGNVNYTAEYSVTPSTVDGEPTSDGAGTLTENGTVTITNERIMLGSVKVTNTVDGAMGSYSDEFTYTLKLYDATGKAAPDDEMVIPGGPYTATITNDSEPNTSKTVTITFGSDGQATQMTQEAPGSTAEPIKLAHNDTLTISGLPAGATLMATETKNSMGYTVTVTEGTGGVTDDGEVTSTVTVPSDSSTKNIAFTNSRAAIIPTGLREENHPYIVMIGLAGMAALVGAAGWVEMRRRKRREEE